MSEKEIIELVASIEAVKDFTKMLMSSLILSMRMIQKIKKLMHLKM